MPTVKAAAYCRFSSDNQRDGYSIEAQLTAIRSYCEKEGISLVREYVDEARSGTTDQRDAFQSMISDSASGEFNCVIVHKLDRFSRDRLDFAIYKKILKDHDVALRSVLERIDDTPESVIMESLLEGMAEYYSRNLSRETLKGLKVRASKGLAVNNRPFGLDVDKEGHFHQNPALAPIVREIFDRVASGESLTSVARSLNEKGLRGRRGSLFSYNSIQKIIRNTLYYGDYTFRGEVVARGCVEPIVTLEEWTLANSKLKDNKNAVYARHRQEDYLLTGLLFCGRCGAHYSGHCSHGGSGKIYRRYRCTNSAHHKCDAPVVNKEALEAFVLSAIEYDLGAGEVVPELTRQLQARLKERARAVSVDPIKKELASIESQSARLLDLYLAGGLEKDAFITKNNALIEKRKRLELELKSAQKASIVLSEDVVRAAIKYYFESVRVDAEFGARGIVAFLNAVIERIVMYPDYIEIVYKIKTPDGGSFTNKVSRSALSANSGCIVYRLSARHYISSFRAEGLVLSDFIEYTLLA